MFIRFIALAAVCAGVLSFTGCCCGPVACGTSCDPQAGCNGLPVRLATRAAGSIVNPCGDGCGEVYWGERINHPPVLDPCGCEQSFRPLMSRLCDLWGRPYVGACECASSGCDSCDSCDSGGIHTAHAVSIPTSYSAPGCSSCMANQPSRIPVTTAQTPVQRVQTATRKQPTPAVRQAEGASTMVQPNSGRDLQATSSSSRHIRPASTSRMMIR